jgi:hypothetical protein
MTKGMGRFFRSLFSLRPETRQMQISLMALVENLIGNMT